MKACCCCLGLLAIAALMSVSLGEASPKYVVEVYFVVDIKAVKLYHYLLNYRKKAIDTIRGDVDFLVYQVNKYYQTLSKHGLDVEIRMKKLDFVKEDLFAKCSPSSYNKRQANCALEQFIGWLDGQGADHTVGYDVAIVWTGYDMFTTKDDAGAMAGIARMDSVCTETNAVGIVEFTGTQATAYATAHEIAHVLGSPHDKTPKCPSKAGFIMSPIMSSVRAPNRWDFSACTASSIRNNLERLTASGSNCLTNTTTPPSTFDLASQLGRDIVNVEKTCQRHRRYYGSYFCTYIDIYSDRQPKGDTVCQTIYCSMQGHRNCGSALPTEGTTCDVGKRCERGRCVTAPTSFPARNISDPNCMFGDIQSGVISNTMTSCRGFVSLYGNQYCDEKDFRSMCCETCANEA